MQLKERINHKFTVPSVVSLVVLACISIFINAVHAAPVIQIGDDDKSIDLSAYVDVYFDSDAPAPSLDSAKAMLSAEFSNKFSPINLNDHLQRENIFKGSDPIWMRFVVENHGRQPSHYWMALEKAVISGSQLYTGIITSSGVDDLQQVRRYQNGSDEELFYRISTKNNEKRVYLLAQSRDKLRHLSVILKRPHTIFKEHSFETRHVSVVLGMFFLLSLIFFAISLERKSKIFFYFTCYCTSLLMVISLSFFIQKNGMLSFGIELSKGVYLCAFFAGTSALLLMRQYLLSYNCIQPFQQIIPFAILINAIIYSLLSALSERYSSYAWLPFLLILPIVVSVLIHIYQRTQDKIAVRILVSRLVFSVVVAYFLLKQSEWQPISLFVHLIIVSFLIADLLFLAYCFYRIENGIKLRSIKNKQLLQLNEVKHKAQQDVFSQLSQDLRTPISAIIGTAEILKSGNLSQDQAHHIQGIEQSAHDVLNKITDIYHRTKSFQETEHIEMAPFEIHYLIEQCLESFSTDIKKRSLELIVDVDNAIEHVVIGHSFFLRTILIELIENSIKSTAQGHIILRAEYIDKEAGRIRFTIEDTGRGIETAQLEVLNEAVQFSRVNPDASGFNLVKQLLFQLDSKLTVESHIGEGCSVHFDVYLPTSTMTISSKALDASSLVSKRLLIVDDNHSYSRVLRSAANSWGLEAYESYEGVEALALYRAKDNIGEPFDAIIIDNDIPNMPAIEVIRRVAEFSGVMPAVIMLAGFGTVPSVEECKAAGIDIVLNKPVSQRLIQRTLINLIESQQQQKTLTYSKTRVLIAEDNDVSRRVISKMMEVLDVEYKLVSDGKLAVDAVKKGSYDIILMDCEMPIMNGFDAAEAIHAWQAENFTTQTPIYALTAHVFDEYEERSKNSGMQGFLEKPIQLSELSNLINKHSVL